MHDHHEYIELEYPGGVRQYPGLEQLICVAMADPAFASQLLIDPPGALIWISASISLTPLERRLVASITGASDIHDFAARLHARVQQERRES